jgi:prevent-host-death family protein
VFVQSPNHKGNVAELAIAAEAAKLGIPVLKPLTEHERYDLVFEVGGRLLRVQCKWAPRKGDVILVPSQGSWYSPGRGYVRTSYSPDEVDLIAAYCEELGACYVIPVKDFPGQTQFHLRLAPARNGQRAALHFADDFRLGAVAQLAERRRGTAEAGGSSPPSSTPSDSAPITVGAHEFRNHFGWYMQRAAAGESFLVTRRGKPLARLSPPPGRASQPVDAGDTPG